MRRGPDPRRPAGAGVGAAGAGAYADGRARIEVWTFDGAGAADHEAPPERERIVSPFGSRSGYRGVHAFHSDADLARAVWVGVLDGPEVAQCRVRKGVRSGQRYGERLRAAGVPTVVSRHAGMIHGFFGLVGLVDKSEAVLAEASAWLRGVSADRGRGGAEFAG